MFVFSLTKKCICLLTESVGSSKVILVGELRSLLSNMFSPLTELTSGVLEPSVLNKVIGETWVEFSKLCYALNVCHSIVMDMHLKCAIKRCLIL